MGAVTYLIATVVGPHLAFGWVSDVQSFDILSAAMVSLFRLIVLALGWLPLALSVVGLFSGGGFVD